MITALIIILILLGWFLSRLLAYRRTIHDRDKAGAFNLVRQDHRLFRALGHAYCPACGEKLDPDQHEERGIS
jgi:ABC-type nickel/cobalt efflux system permease component RcnA